MGLRARDVIILLIGLGFGWMIGYSAGIDACVNIGLKVLNAAGIDITQFNPQIEFIIKSNLNRLGL